MCSSCFRMIQKNKNSYIITLSNSSINLLSESAEGRKQFTSFTYSSSYELKDNKGLYDI